MSSGSDTRPHTLPASADGCLRDRRVLVVEDEFLLADQLRSHLVAAGAEVVGPVGTVARALALLDEGIRVDGAVLDVNLRGERVFPLADRLVAQRVPIILASGYGEAIFPARFRDVARCEKPLDMAKLLAALSTAMEQ